MKKLVFTALVMLSIGASFCHADSAYSVTVTTNSTIVLPYADASGLSITAWATGTTYDQGDYCRVGSARYWTPNGGTTATNYSVSTNYYNPMTATWLMKTNFTGKPTHRYGTEAGTDGINWKPVDGSGREVLYLFSEATNEVYYSVDGNDATSSSGGILTPDEPSVRLEHSPSFEINFFTYTPGTSTVRVVEQ